LLLAKGVTDRVNLEVLGHAEIGVTMNTYAHVLPVPR
jgi:site-specific recombinase XerD